MNSKMKRLILLVASILMMFTAHKANAYDFFAINNGQIIYYNITSSTAPRTVEVTYSGYSEYSGEIVIPSTVNYQSNRYTVTAMGDFAFSECSGLTSIIIGNSVRIIGNWVFTDCSGLTGVLTIPNSVITIGNYAFENCSGLTSITIGNSVKIIGDWIFSGCRRLTSINVDPDNFNYSSNNGVLFNKIQDTLLLCPIGKTGSYTIPNSVTTIGDYSFSELSGLTSVTIPNTVTTISDWAFTGCRNLTNIDVEPDNSNYSSDNGILFNKSQDILLQCPAGKTGNYTIPNSVTTIGRTAFYYCNSLTTIIIPNTVTIIGDWAFFLCSGLTGSLTIPNSVTIIGNWAFTGCSGLTGTLTIPNSVMIIGSRAFIGCISLTSVTIGNSVTIIGDSAFSGCRGLTEMHIKAIEPPQISEYTFDYVSKFIPVYVCGLVANYRKTAYWSEFINITQ
jgi:hypothetical protein